MLHTLCCLFQHSVKFSLHNKQENTLYTIIQKLSKTVLETKSGVQNINTNSNIYKTCIYVILPLHYKIQSPSVGKTKPKIISFRSQYSKVRHFERK